MDGIAASPFAAHDRSSLLDFWGVYDAHYESVQSAAMGVALEHPEFGPLVRAMSVEQREEEDRRSRALLRDAIVDGKWERYAADTRSQGTAYAKLGVTFGGWYEVVTVFQRMLVPALVNAFAAEPARLSRAITAMLSFIDYAMTLIAEQYFRVNEEERLRSLIDSVEDYAIIMLDADGRVATWNAGARVLEGYEAHEIVGKHLSVFHTALERDAGKHETELRVASDEGRFEEEGWRVRKDGTQFWANVVVTPIRNGRGRLTGFAKVTRDLTERRRKEEELHALVQRLEERTSQLEEANAELDGFSYSVSHDLRAPLRAIDGFARVLLEDHAPRLDDDGKRVAHVICKNSQKIGKLIDDLLRFARLGRQALRVERLDMTAGVRRAAAEVLDPARSIDLRVAELPEAEADAALIQQVWANLLSNAAKYSRARAAPIIEVMGEHRNGESVYAVKDNGVGFDPQYKGKLFGVFHRLHPASEFEGMGVGLALVQRIVHRHGGWVKADGKVGEGATFSFALPRKDGADGT